MTSRNRVLVLQILLSVVLTFAGFGCNSSSAPSSAPPPPAISVTVSPATATVIANGTQLFTSTVTNDPSNKGVQWTVICPATQCGSVSPGTTASGVATTYSAPATQPGGNLTVTVTATSVASPTTSNSATITIPGITVTVAPNPSTIQAGSTMAFTATVTDDLSNKGVTWTVSCSAAPCGTVSPASTASAVPTTYSAPTTPPPSDLSVTLTAASVTNPSASASVSFKVPAVTVSVSPGSALLPAGIAQQFTATVGNDPSNGGVSWVLTQGGTACSPACGSVAPSNTASGSPATYTAPAKLPANTAVNVVATSVTDTTKTASSAITLTSGTVQLVPYSMDFGNVLVGDTSSPQLTTLTNTGGSPLSISSIAISGTNAGDYSQTNTCNSSVGSGSSCTISVTFKPTARGTRTADVSVTDSSTDSPQQVSLTGIGYTRGEDDAAAVRSSLAVAGPTAVPAPTGPQSVGTRVIHVIDSTREDPYLANRSARELAIRFWYPAAIQKECKTAEYTSADVWEYFAQLVGVKPFQVTTNSCLNAPVSDGPHPVVVFTPGYTATFTDYTFLMEDLASRGYIVASVAHTYEATAVELSNGSLAKSVLGSHLDDSWHGNEATFSFATYVRLQDLESVVNELNRLNSEAGGAFSGQLDVSKIAIAGHSMGGVTAFLAANQDPRFKTVVMLDAVIPRAAVATTKTPVLLLAGGTNWDDSQKLLWNSLEGPRLAVSLTGSEHVAFSDWIWLAKDAIRTGPMGPEKTMSAVRAYAAAFLDANLRGEPASTLLSGSSPDYPDAVVTAGNKLLITNTSANPIITVVEQ